MAKLRNRRKPQASGVRGLFREKLVRDRDYVLMRGQAVEIMSSVLGFYRIDAIDRGEPIEVRGYEIRDFVQGVERSAFYLIERDGRLRANPKS